METTTKETTPVALRPSEIEKVPEVRFFCDTTHPFAGWKGKSRRPERCNLNFPTLYARKLHWQYVFRQVTKLGPTPQVKA